MHQRQEKNYNLKVLRGSVIQVGDRVLVRNVALRGKDEIADRWQDDVYVVTAQLMISLRSVSMVTYGVTRIIMHHQL